MSRILDRSGKPKRNEPYLDHCINKHDNVPLWVIINNLYLGQAFRFYDYPLESIRFPIERRLQALYAETYFEVKRITHKDLKNAFGHIEDFRNKYAHDERLYCTQIDKSGSTKFKDAIDDLELVLAAKQFSCSTGGGNHEHHYRNIIRNPRNRGKGHARADGLFIPGRNLPFRRPTPLQPRTLSQTIKTTSNNNRPQAQPRPYHQNG